MLTRMQQRRGTQAEWNDSVIASTVILQAGELGLETDTGRFKIGNGVTVWQDLPYYLPDDNPSNAALRQGKNNNDIYAKLSPLAPTFTQTFTGAQVLVPNSSSQIPLVVSGVSGQSAVLQRWRNSNDVTLASIDQTGKLTAAGGASFNADVNMNGHKITNLATPTSDNDAVNKVYVDDAIAGLAWKESVQLIAHGPGSNVALTGATNTLNIDTYGALSSSDSGYRILLSSQTNATENGIYVYNDNGTTYTLTRAADADTPAELVGASVFVQEGTLYGTSSWVQSNHYIDSFDDQLWVQFSGAALITAGDGMTKDGNRLDVVGTADRITANADSIDIASTYVGQTSITTLGTVTTGTWDASVIDETKGGTGQSSYAVGDILYADTTTSLNKLTAGTAGHPLVSGGPSTAPAYGQVNTAGIADDAVTLDKIQNIPQYRVLGRISAGSGNTQEINSDELMTIINQGNNDIAFSLLPVGTTSTTVAQGDHTHTLDQLSDVEISATPTLRQVLKYDGTKWINELPSGGISIGATPPLDASSGDAWFDSTDGSLYVYYDDGSGSVARTNLVPNPSFETNLTGWSGNNGSSLTLDSTEYYVGTKSAKVNFTGPFSNQLIGYSAGVAVTPGKSYTFSMWAKLQSGANYKVYMFDNSTQYTVDVIGTGSWQRVSATRTVASTPLTFGLIYDSGGTVAHSIYVDAALLEEASPVQDYFDGDTVGCAWTGTPHASTSTKASTTVGTAQWVQVKANSALEASILTRLSALEARSTDIEAANAVRVANQAERDSVYPAPVQGNTVFRADLGYEEKYYAAYNSTTNPDGTRATAGWYEYRGSSPLSKNYVINGAFDFWQRGTSSTTVGLGYYTADRFATAITGSGTWSRESSIVPARTTYSLEFTASASNTFGTVYYTMETLDAEKLAGKVVTVSLDTYAGLVSNSFTVSLGWSASVDNPSSGTWTTITPQTIVGQLNTWSRGFASFTVPSNARSLQLRIANANKMSATDFYAIANVQLEEGPVPTPFRRNQENIQAELAACQRYYYRVNQTDYETLFGTGVQATTSSAVIFVPLPVVLRAVPSSVTLFNAKIGDQVTFNSAATITGFNRSSTSGLMIYASFSPANGAASRPAFLQGSGVAPYNSYIDVSAEL